MANAKENYTALAKEHVAPWMVAHGWKKDRGYLWTKSNSTGSVLVKVLLSKYFTDTPEVVAISLQIMVHDPEITRQREEVGRKIRESGQASEAYFGEIAIIAQGEVVADDNLPKLAQKFYRAIERLTDPFVSGSQPLGAQDRPGWKDMGLYNELLCNGQPKVFTSWNKTT